MIKSTISKCINKLLSLFGLRLIYLSNYPVDKLSLYSVFRRMKARGIYPATVIDIGASDGRWTKTVKGFYPEARCHLIEANQIHEKGLIDFVNDYPGCSYKLAVAAETVGKVFFDASDPFGGLAHLENENRQFIQIPCTTVDEEVSINALQGPFLLKLDTHGFEVPIFNGAQKTLTKTSVIIVETYNFDLTKESLKFWEICDFLFQHGFRPIDLLDPMFRPKDEAFWQVDLVFIRSDREEFRDNTYD